MQLITQGYGGPFAITQGYGGAGGGPGAFSVNESWTGTDHFVPLGAFSTLQTWTGTDHFVPLGAFSASQAWTGTDGFGVGNSITNIAYYHIYQIGTKWVFGVGLPNLP